MRRTLCLVAIGLGLLARLHVAVEYDHPRGDVVLDVGVTRSLAAGEGFRSGFERGTALVRGEGAVPPQSYADQHPPLWAVLGAPFAALGLHPFAALRLVSLLFGLLLLAQVWRLTDRLTEGVVGAPDGLPALATALTALSFLMVEFSANGALYMAQASLLLLLIECLASPRPSAWRAGSVMGCMLLLNHQCLVLLPLLPLAWVLGVPRCQRWAGALRGLGALAVAALVQVPWWWRNALVFGDPGHSVNGLYLLARLGVEPQLLIEHGLPVARLVGGPAGATLLSAFRSSLAPNLLYLFVAASLVLPMLLGVVAVGALPGAREAVRSCDRRRVAAWGALALMVAVAVLWPAMKLRYLVTIMPLGTALGVAALGAGLGKPARQGRGVALLGTVWLLLVVMTFDDVMGTAELPRPGRWWWLVAGGLFTVVLPALLHSAQRGPAAALPLERAGLPLAAVLLGLTLAHSPPTAYHGTGFLPDFFGQDAEGQETELGEALARLVETPPEGVPGPLSADPDLVVGPVALLAWERPDLVTLPLGAGSEAGAAALAALLDAERPDGRRVGHVVTRVGDGWLPEDARAGHTWLDGRLAVVAVVDPDPDVPGGVQLSRVLP